MLQFGRVNLRSWLSGRTIGLGLLCLWGLSAGAANYAVVVSGKTRADIAWQPVVEKVRETHAAKVVAYEASVEETLPQLRELNPRYVCFVARPTEVTREFVAAVHCLTRQFNDDPYTDCLWGILTGYDAANALRIASQREPLTVRRVAAGTEVALELCEEGVWHSELKAGHRVRKVRGGRPEAQEGPADSTEALVKTLTEYRADLFVTSGHATERDWQIGFAYRNGTFQCEAGTLLGIDLEKRKHPIQSPNPKVYLPVGNCLMGHIDSTNAMALAFLNSGGVCQMMGYTMPTWYGYAGWGCLDYFLEQPGRYTFAEAFFANQAALIHRLQTYFPDLASAALDKDFRPKAAVRVSEAARAAGLKAQDALGLSFDRDTVAFYGDPAWEARMADQAKPFDQNLEWKDGRGVFEVRPNRGGDSFKPVNSNGSQRGNRPFIGWLPRPVKRAQILEGAEFKPVITANFILVPRPAGEDAGKTLRVVFSAEAVE